MRRISPGLRAVAWTLLAAGCLGLSRPVFAEDFRPVYHFAPRQNWMNEPNGLIRIGSTWHLFFQHNPSGNVWANLSWGHATSPDLLNWMHRPVALAYEDGVMSFSGTAVADPRNLSGLGTARNPPYLAFYTGHQPDGGIQDQRLAFSLDEGVTWRKYAGNPIISAEQEAPHDVTDGRETRDPKVLWHEASRRWVMVLTHGGQNKASFWTSPNALDWTWRSDVSELDLPGLPGDIEGWEVPDFFELPIIGESGTRWVLLITSAKGSPAGGNGVLALTGSFDGTKFSPDAVDRDALWLDYGRDFDGVISWANVPERDGRRILAGVMNSYGDRPPTRTWKGMLSFPRVLTLRRVDGGFQFFQQPVAELDQAATEIASIKDEALVPGDVHLGGVEGSALDIRIACRPAAGSTLVLAVRQGGSEQTVIRYDRSSERLSVDRRASGDTSFSPEAGGVHLAPLTPDVDGVVRLRVLVDTCSVEVFGGRGEVVISNLIFPDAGSKGLSLTCSGGDVLLDSVGVFAVGLGARMNR